MNTLLNPGKPRRNRLRRWWPALLLVALGAAVALTGCDRLIATRIGDILARPRDFDGKVVTVAGEVSGGANVIIVKAFTVKDGTGEILVITDRAVPNDGAKVRVTGRVDQAFSIGSESLVVIRESAR